MRRRGWLKVTFACVVFGVALGAPGVGDGAVLPKGEAAIVDGVPGGGVRLTIEQFDKRKVQVQPNAVTSRRSRARRWVKKASARFWKKSISKLKVAEMTIVVGHRQIARAFRRIKLRDFSSIRQFQAYLRSIRVTEAEARQRVKIQVLSQRIENHVVAGVPGVNRAAVLRRFVNAYLRRWRSRTVCRAEIASERCSNGPPVSSIPEVGFGTAPAPRRTWTS